MRFAGVFNRDGGTFRTIDLEAFVATAHRILEAHGHGLEAHVVSGKDLNAELERAARTGADVLLAGGGDGTISAAAAVAFRTGIPLAVLPAGTMNLFARGLHLPLDLEQALEAIAEGAVRPMDIATVNGRPFIHQYSVGLHTRVVRIRQSLSYRGRWGKILATARAFFGAILRPPRFVVEIETDRGIERRACSAVIVSNDPLGETAPPGVSTLEGGTLGLYAARPLTVGQSLRLGLDIVLRRWRESPVVTEREVQRVVLAFPRRRPSDRATIDGEMVALEPRVEIVSHPDALKVVAPLESGSPGASRSRDTAG